MSITLFMIGDSTMANKHEPEINPEHGWGQILPEFVGPGAMVDNHAADGRSTRRFVDEERWAAVENKLQPGDWLIIQFGHNDQKIDQPNLYADAATDYPAYLKRFVETARAKGAHPLLATSIYRRQFDAEGQLVDSHGAYPDAMRAVAAETATPLVDLHKLTGELFQATGAEGTIPLFLHYAPGEHPYYPDGKQDNTHLSRPGARHVAQLFVEDVKCQGLSLAECFR